MNEPTQRLADLDADTRAVIREHYASIHKRIEAAKEIDSLAAAIRKRRYERRLRLMDGLGMEASALIERARSIQADERQDTRELLEQATKVSGRNERGRTNTRPPVIAADTHLVASLDPYYVYEIYVDTGAFIRDEIGSPPPPFQVYSEVFGAGDGRDDATDRYTATIEVNWLFKFVPTESGYYNFFPTTAYFGKYTVISDDGICTSKQAHVEMSLKGAVSSGGSSTPAATLPPLLHRDSDNIYEVNREMGAPGGGGEAQLHMLAVPIGANVPAIVTLTHRLYVYARGEGSHAQLNFQSGQYGLGPVWCYVFYPS
jgi:hypothetical protein